MRKATGILAILAAIALIMAMAQSIAVAEDPPGANGTVKIHEGDSEAEPIMRNEPHVCTFHVHGFNFDSAQTGRWWIERWAPTGSGVAMGPEGWTANSAGDWRTSVRSLPEGHYKLFVELQHEAGASGNTQTTFKHKVFWVDCDGGQGQVTTTGTTGAATTGAATTGTTGAATTGTTGAASTGTTGAATTGTTGGQGQVTTSTTGTTGGAGPDQEVIVRLPSTSTGNGGMAVLGAMLAGLGAYLLRRPKSP